MPLNFADIVPVKLVDTVGLLIGAFVLIMVLLELVRWRNVLSPIAKGMKLGAGKWLQILIRTLKNEAIYQQIDIGFEKRKWFSHSLVMWGFILLAVSTTLNWIYDPNCYPLPIWHSVRITGNLGGLLFIMGLVIIAIRYGSNDLVTHDTVGVADYLFAFLLAAAGITGFATEFTSELNAAGTIFSIYATHLVFCAALLVTAPFTKFVHAIGRPLLRLSENYLAALNPAQALELTPVAKSEA